MSATVLEQKVRGHLLESFLSFHHVAPKDGTQVIRLGGNHGAYLRPSSQTAFLRCLPTLFSHKHLLKSSYELWPKAGYVRKNTSDLFQVG